MQSIIVDGKEIRFVLDRPNSNSNYGIIFISGVTAGGVSNRWKPLAKCFKDNGFYFLRYESWRSDKELENYTLKELHDEISALVSILKEKGCRKIGVIGKSFGGCIALTYQDKSVSKMVLMAPAIGIAKKNNINKWENRYLRDRKKLTDIKLDNRILLLHPEPILIIHGTKDNVIPISNSIKIYKNGKHIKLKKLIGADHSYRDQKYEDKLIGLSINFFKNDL